MIGFLWGGIVVANTAMVLAPGYAYHRRFPCEMRRKAPPPFFRFYQVGMLIASAGYFLLAATWLDLGAAICHFMISITDHKPDVKFDLHGFAVVSFIIFVILARLELWLFYVVLFCVLLLSWHWKAGQVISVKVFLYVVAPLRLY